MGPFSVPGTSSLIQEMAHIWKKYHCNTGFAIMTMKCTQICRSGSLFKIISSHLCSLPSYSTCFTVIHKIKWNVHFCQMSACPLDTWVCTLVSHDICLPSVTSRLMRLQNMHVIYSMKSSSVFSFKNNVPKNQAPLLIINHKKPQVAPHMQKFP